MAIRFSVCGYEALLGASKVERLVRTLTPSFEQMVDMVPGESRMPALSVLTKAASSWSGESDWQLVVGEKANLVTPVMLALKGLW